MFNLLFSYMFYATQLISQIVETHPNHWAVWTSAFLHWSFQISI